LDYSGMHPRLLYHLANVRFDSDPYALWGEKTTPPMRLLAKQLINTAINATTEAKAISACNQAMSTTTKEGEGKTGAALLEAQRLYAAFRERGLKFKQIYELAQRRHRRISQYFGT